MQKLLTIVVPVYKVEQYINKCLDSCIIYKADGTLDEDKMNQLEVIIVNDGTPDNSAELSRAYTVRYPQTFRQIDQENRGHGGAWNTGLKEATGKYLRFLDSDDWLTNLDKLMEKLAETDADLVITNMQNVYIDSEPLATQFTEKENIIKPIEELSPANFQNHWNIGNFHTATYKTILLQNVAPLFLEGVSYDDSILFEASLLLSQNYIYYDFVLYNYLLGRVGQSVDLQVQQNKIYDRIKNLKHELTFYKKHNNIANVVINDFVVALLIGEYQQIFSIAKGLNIKKSRSIITEADTILKGFDIYEFSHSYRRYKKFPFVLFWLLEHFRNLKIKN